MTFTVGNVLADAWHDLNDPLGGRRWPQASMEGWCSDGIEETKGLRPDLFYGSITTELNPFVSADPVPLPDRYRHALVTYVKSRALRLNTDRGSKSEADSLYKGFVELVTNL